MHKNAHEIVVYLANAGYLFTHYLTAPLYLLFVISLTDAWYKLRQSIVRQILLILPCFVVLAAFVMNPVNRLLFSVENGYERGPLFGILYVTTILYVIYDICYFIRYRKLFGIANIVAVSAIIPINVAALLIQFFIPNALIEMFCGAIGLLIIGSGLQRPEDYIDTFTHLMKYSAYVHDMKRSFYNEKHVHIIMINIADFQKIQTIIGFDSAREALKLVADKMRRINRKMHGSADLYHLDNGRFRLVFRENKQEQAEAVAEALNQELKEQIPFNGLNISLMPFVILAHCPEEIKDFKTLISFGADFQLKNHYTGEIMYAGKLYDWNQLDVQNNIDFIIEQALENIERLSQAGLGFSLDDYGTGYSNMKHVIQLPLKIIKLDKSFADEKNNPKMWTVIKNTVKMLKDMNMEVVVEGVETQEALDMFASLKCDFIQRYFFSKPIPRKDFVTFISNARKG